MCLTSLHIFSVLLECLNLRWEVTNAFLLLQILITVLGTAEEMARSFWNRFGIWGVLMGMDGRLDVLRNDVGPAVVFLLVSAFW